MISELVEQSFIRDRFESRKLKDVGLVEVGPSDLPLPVEGREGEELQEDDSYDYMMIEPEVSPMPFGCEVDVSGVSAIALSKRREASHEHVRNRLFLESEERPRPRRNRPGEGGGLQCLSAVCARGTGWRRSKLPPKEMGLQCLSAVCPRGTAPDSDGLDAALRRLQCLSAVCPRGTDSWRDGAFLKSTSLQCLSAVCPRGTRQHPRDPRRRLRGLQCLSAVCPRGTRPLCWAADPRVFKDMQKNLAMTAISYSTIVAMEAETQFGRNQEIRTGFDIGRMSRTALGLRLVAAGARKLGFGMEPHVRRRQEGGQPPPRQTTRFRLILPDRL